MEIRGGDMRSFDRARPKRGRGSEDIIESLSSCRIVSAWALMDDVEEMVEELQPESLRWTG